MPKILAEVSTVDAFQGSEREARPSVCCKKRGAVL